MKLLPILSIISILLLLSFTSGCALFTKTVEVKVPVERIITKTVEVKVPVIEQCPEPPTLEKPHLAIFDLMPTDESGKVVKAYKATVKTLQGHVLELETALDGYRQGNSNENK